MKRFFTLSILLLAYMASYAQPSNDDCDNATNISLSTPPSCPTGGSVNTVISGTNIGATPATPYPTFTGCNPGGNTTGPAAEVWFSFVATGNTNTFTITGGLSTPNIVIFTGGNCQFLAATACASGMPGTNVVTLADVNLTPGNTYFILVSGGDINDQGNFTLTVQSENDCALCTSQNGQFVTVNPPPANGTYASGTTVQFCYTLSEWDLTGTVEWFHGIQITLGSGWDQFSLIPDWANTIAPPCPTNPGAFVWSDFWVGCTTQNTFGPGFAYDGTTGLGCNGTPQDGDPGNNWGYGGGGVCEVITPANALTFCFYATVNDCPPNDNGADLSVIIEPLSDGESGSWTQVGCNSGVSYDFLASSTCCSDPDPLAFSTPTSCLGGSDGSITYEGGAGIVTGPWNYTVFDAAGNVIHQSNGVPGPETLSNLPAGMYNVLAINALSGCSRSTFVTIDDGLPPTAIATANMPCPGNQIQLMGDVIPGGSTVQYVWTAPSGAVFTDQNPLVNQPGTYTLEVTVDGCAATPATVNADFIFVSTSAFASPAEVCSGDLITLSATGGDIYDWGGAGFGQILQVVAPIVVGTQTITYTVNITTAEGCSATETVDVVVNQLPEIEIIAPLEACEGETITLNAIGGVVYDWNTSQTGPLISATIGAGPIEEFSVTATDANGCPGDDIHFINVNPLPTVTATASPDVVCAGEQVTLSATGGQFYDWLGETTGQSITVTPSASTIYEVVVTDANGCQNTTTVSVAVEQPITAPVVSCGNITPSSVEFTWPAVTGATGYDVTVDVGPAGTLNGTTYTVNGLAPGELVTITVAALSPNSCPDQTTTFSCNAQNCAPVGLSASGTTSFCLDADSMPDTLMATITTPMMDGDTIWSGNGIVDSLLGVFDPTVADTGTHEIVLTYIEELCTYYDTLSIVVYQTPTATFTSNADSICISDSLTITYMGTADTSAFYAWNFNGGMANPGTGQGPHNVIWPSDGVKIISLTVTENGCLSAVFTDTITVLNPLVPPVVICEEVTTTSVLFSWNDVAGASSYNVNVLTGQAGTLNGTTFLVDNLMPQEIVDIVVTAVDAGPCSDVSTSFSCAAEACPDFIISITSVPDICLDTNTADENLSVNVNGGTGMGTGVWSGTGITDANAGIFSPAAAGVGIHTIYYDYAEGPCSGTDSTIITIYPTPTADFVISSPDACVDSLVTITYTGTASSGANFSWSFNGGDAVPGTGIGPHTVSWNSAGTKNVTLIVEENGCTSSSFTQSIDISDPLPAPVISCNTTTFSVEFSWMDVPGAVSYNVTVLQGAMGTLNGNSYLVDNLNPGDVVEISVEAVGTGPCGNSIASLLCMAEDCPQVNVSIDSIVPICLDASAGPITLSVTLNGDNGMGTGTWSGPGITDMATGTFDPNIAGVGTPTVTYTYTEDNCVYTETRVIIINAQPTATFTVDDNICIDQASTLTYTGSASAGATYQWSFDGGVAVPGNGAGPHEVSWTSAGTKTISLIVTENDCSSEAFTQDVDVDPLLPEPVINCNTTTSSVEFSWMDVPGAASYNVTVVQGPMGTLNGTSYLIDNLNPGDVVEITVEAVGTGACGNSMASLSCVAEDCPQVTVSIDSVAPICLDATVVPINLTVTLSGDNGMGTGTWSGPGITDMIAGTFDPVVAGVGTPIAIYTYMEGNCTYTASRSIEINAQPTATFTVDDSICIDQSSTIFYTGTGSLGADYQWNFDGGMAIPGTGQGPHEVNWTSGGTKNITLTVIENDCASETHTQEVFVDVPLAAPVISCNSTTSSITFSWMDVPGAASYNVTVLQGPMGVSNGNSYMVDNLNPGDVVEISVEAVGTGPCGNSMASLSCVAEDCPDVMVSIDSIAPQCLNGLVVPVNLTVTLSGDNGLGTGTWSGPGIIDVMLGTFDPIIAGEGTPTVVYTYIEGNCTYTASQTIEVNAPPIGGFTVDDSICIDLSSTILYVGSAGPDADYQWNFDGGTAVPGIGQGPHEVTWTTGGTKSVTLIVNENDCISDAFLVEEVFVDIPLTDPVISCNTTTSSITFSWMDVPEAVSYNVTVLQGPMGVLNGTSYLVDNLNPGDVVEIEVEAVGVGPCGNSMASLSCIAEDCPDVMVSIDSVAPICLGGAGVPFNLTATLSGDNGMGTGTWSGPGIIDMMLGTFDPIVAGIGMPTVVYTYVEGNCTYTASRIIEINAIPTATFTVDDSICIDQSSTIFYTGSAGPGADYQWSFDGGMSVPGTGIGPHEVSWTSGGVKTITLTVTENDCVSEVVTQDVFVETPLVAPVIMCTTDNTSITFSWDPVAGATGYQIIDVSGPAGVLNGTTYSVTGLDPGDAVSIQLVIETDNICGNITSEIQTCIAQDCPDVTLDITAIDPLCEDDDPVMLAATATGGDGTGTFTWSGTGVTGNTFDPSMVPQSGDYLVNLVYEEGVCMYNGSLMITVNAVPTADFSVNSPVCEDSIALITYLGSASAGANYQWNFDGGIANPGTGQGPHEVSWATAGTKNIGLTVEENNCASSPFTQVVEVEAPLEQPVITCETTSSSILFTWQAITGAVEYQVVVVSGSAGTLNGTTYFVDGLTPGDEVEIEVIAVGNGPCGNSSSTASCIAQDCTPLTATLSGPTAVCAGDNATITLDISTDATGPFTVTYEVNDNPVTAEFAAGASTIDLAVSINTIIELISIIDNSTPDCVYNGMSTLNIVVEEPTSAGSPGATPQLCEGTDSLITLIDLLVGADLGGVWQETSTTPSTGNAFNAANGTFNPIAQNSGSYTFTYTTGAGGLCPESTATIEVQIAGLPVADAGEDMELTCNMGMVTLGSNSSSGNTFFWSTADSVVISNPNDQFIEVGQPGTYILTTTNAAGCTSTDEVVVSANLEVPVFEASITEISCFEANDGAIILSNITGGQPPYQASINGSAFSSETAFFNLGGNIYDVVVQDANGCISQIEFNLEEPEQVLVTLSTNLEGENVIPLGDSVLLSAIYSPTLNIDTIYWEPDSIGFGSNNASSVWVSPQITSSFSVTIANDNGCSDSDNTVIIVEKIRPVYIPNIFSPNDDGKNDIFYIQGGDNIVRINKFNIFNRWGESLFSSEDFLPNDPVHGWDGTFRGELMNTDVFVYYAEIEFSDGEVILFKGDVTLVR